MDLGDELADRSLEEKGWIAGVPLAVAVFEFELHEVAGDRGEEHLARVAIDGVVELVDFVIAGSAFPHAQPLVSRQYVRHRLGHRRLLRHVQHPHGARHRSAATEPALIERFE